MTSLLIGSSALAAERNFRCQPRHTMAVVVTGNPLLEPMRTPTSNIPVKALPSVARTAGNPAAPYYNVRRHVSSH